MTTLEDLKLSIRDVPDFPKPGILFKDLTTAFKNAELMTFMVDEIAQHYRSSGITKVVGIESRGFIVGGALASALSAGFVPLRKPGKLPAETYSKSYSLEYGINTIELHKDALDKNDVVLLHDDLLATGGTAKAAIDLFKEAGVKKIFCNFIVELDFLKGRSKFDKNFDVFSLVKF